jgi:hypothetical protein
MVTLGDEVTLAVIATLALVDALVRPKAHTPSGLQTVLCGGSGRDTAKTVAATCGKRLTTHTPSSLPAASSVPLQHTHPSVRKGALIMGKKYYPTPRQQLTNGAGATFTAPTPRKLSPISPQATPQTPAEALPASSGGMLPPKDGSNVFILGDEVSNGLLSLVKKGDVALDAFIASAKASTAASEAAIAASEATADAAKAKAAAAEAIKALANTGEKTLDTMNSLCTKQNFFRGAAFLATLYATSDPEFREMANNGAVASLETLKALLDSTNTPESAPSAPLPEKK